VTTALLVGEIIIGLAVASLFVVLLGVMRSLESMTEEPKGSSVSWPVVGISNGEAAPAVEGTTVDGSELRSTDWLTRRWELVFVSASCRSCHELISALSCKPRPDALVLVSGSEEEFPTGWRSLDGVNVMRDGDAPGGRYASMYGVEVKPYAVIVEDGLVRSRGAIVDPSDLGALADTVGRDILTVKE